MGRYGARLWPEVSSPAARRVLTYLFNYPSSYTDFDFHENMRQIEQEQKLDDLCVMWALIQGTDLAERLAGGPALLPDICEALPQPYRAIYRILKPRTLEQQVDLVVQHLPWYLAPHTKPRIEARIAAYIFIPAVIVIAAAILFLGFRLGFQQNDAALVALHSVISILIALGLGYAALPWFTRVIIGASPQNRVRNATVLYHFLRAAYADVDQAGPSL